MSEEEVLHINEEDVELLKHMQKTMGLNDIKQVVKTLILGDKDANCEVVIHANDRDAAMKRGQMDGVLVCSPVGYFSDCVEGSCQLCGRKIVWRLFNDRITHRVCTECFENRETTFPKEWKDD